MAAHHSSTAAQVHRVLPHLLQCCHVRGVDSGVRWQLLAAQAARGTRRVGWWRRATWQRHVKKGPLP